MKVLPSWLTRKPQRVSPDSTRAGETLQRAQSAFDQGDIDAALSLANAAREQYERTKDVEGLGHAHDLIGDVLVQLGRLDDAAAHYQEAARQFQRPENDAETFVKIAEMSHYQGNLDQALVAYRKALQLYDKLGDEEVSVLIMSRIGYVLYQQQKWEEAERMYRTAQTKAHALDMEEIVQNNLLEVGNALAQQGRVDEAYRVLDQLVARAREGDNRTILAEALHSLAYTYAQKGQRDTASDTYQESLRLKQGLRNKLSLADTLFELGINDGERGKPGDARGWFDQAATIYKALNANEQLNITQSMIEKYG